VIVDNTWLTGVIFNPLKHHADVSLASLTKYYGAGTAIAGAIVFKEFKYFSEA
jgi:cystathionine beta-lyase/cystathionine gamma-synthase